ncbi:NIPSNAP family protein [Nonomuraea cavernae]|uniref:NIPSNAP family containing protein n=1 Tax=Nonomuraea cavernae TaxID=2045107 RepID=A0A917Z754_9ACTN|nr:NIPSNAP family protein [Nonomuraea cavernae]MCA2189357.1 NIPSNAP family protein [Nonomuraea cavernae]GGO77014.1 NIPSNAP family containing protein [Nonomuraea cavernae]
MIYELRQYTLRPGRRETLIELFEREFVESQEEAGMGVVAQFRDLDAPDMFSWIRKFPDMEARRLALATFYGGPVWKANRDAANDTMIDSDNVLLLRPPAGSADPFPAADRPPIGATALPPAHYVATIYHVGEGFSAFFAGHVRPVLAEAGVPPVACLESEHAANTFPALPVRTGENVFVWFARFDRPEDERDVPLPMLEGRLTAAPQRLRLAPTARSALR